MTAVDPRKYADILSRLPQSPDMMKQERDIRRRRLIAQQLVQMGSRPHETQMAGRLVVPYSPWQGLADVASQVAGALMERRASRDEDELNERRWQEMRSMFSPRAAEQPAPTPTTALDTPQPAPAVAAPEAAQDAAPALSPRMQDIARFLASGDGNGQTPELTPHQQGLVAALGGKQPQAPEPSASPSPSAGMRPDREMQPQSPMSSGQPPASSAPLRGPLSLSDNAERDMMLYMSNPEAYTDALIRQGSPGKFSTDARFTRDGRAYVLSDTGAVKFLDPGVTARDKLENINGVWENPYEVSAGEVAPQNLDDLVIRDPKTGRPVINQPALSARTQVARAGASSVNNYLPGDKGFAATFGPAAADVVKETSMAARGAVQKIDAAHQILTALDRGGVSAGPATTAGMWLKQAFGKDPEGLRQTRTVIRGLANLSLSARKALQGQGQITEGEQALLEKANSGDIDSLSLGEVRTMAELAERAARLDIQENRHYVDLARRQPGVGNTTEFFDVEMPAPYRAPSAGKILSIREVRR